MNQSIKLLLIAAGGYLGWQWLQSQQPDQEPAASPSASNYTPTQTPAQSPAQTPAQTQTSAPTAPGNSRTAAAVTLNAAALVAARGGDGANFWEWNWVIANRIDSGWPNPPAQPYLPGLTDAQIGSLQLTAAQFLNLLSGGPNA